MDKAALTALQARFRAAPCRGTLDALRSRDAAVLELEEAYAREAALKVDVAHAKALVRKAVAAALRKAEAERVDVEKARDDEAKKLALENKKLLQQVEKLKGQLRAAVVAKQHAVHEAELRVTDHFRRKLAAAAKARRGTRSIMRAARCPTPSPLWTRCHSVPTSGAPGEKKCGRRRRAERQYHKGDSGTREAASIVATVMSRRSSGRVRREAPPRRLPVRSAAVFGGGGASGGGPRRWMRSRCKLRSTELICRKSGSASSSSGPIDRRGVSARASMEGDGDGDDGDSSSIDETRNLLTPRSRRASSVSLRERLPVAVEPFSLRSSSSASGRGGGYWRSIVYCSGRRRGGWRGADPQAVGLVPATRGARAALEPARQLVRWES